MKKIVSIILTALIIGTLLAGTLSLTSCGDKGDDEVISPKRPYTITLTMPMLEGTTKEAVLEVEKALTAITKTKFKANLVLNFVKESEYDKLIEQMIENEEKKLKEAEEAEKQKKLEESSRKEAAKTGTTTRKKQQTTEETSEAFSEQFETDEYGLKQTVYPDIEGDTQLDIFLIKGAERFAELQKRKDEAAAKGLNLDVSDALQSITNSMNLMDRGVFASLDYYRSRIENSAIFPRETLDAAFEEVKAEQKQQDDFSQALRYRVDMYKKHVYLLRRGDRAALSRDRLNQDILPERFR